MQWKNIEVSNDLAYIFDTGLMVMPQIDYVVPGYHFPIEKYIAYRAVMFNGLEIPNGNIVLGQQ